MKVLAALFVIAAAVGIFLFAGAGADNPATTVEENAPPAAVSSGGMVSSGHELATRAGTEILSQGGNAFDAAVAVAATLTVVEPTSSNLFGGYGTLIVFDAEKAETRYLDNNGRFPAATDSDVFRPPADLGQMMRTAKAVSTPGNLDGFERLWESYGSVEWRELLAPATRHAEEGFEISAGLARAIGSTWKHFGDYAREIYGRDGEPLRPGDPLIQTDLARSLRLAASEGAEAVYGGEIGRAIDTEMQRRGGFLSLADLEAHQSEWFEPIQIDYRGHQIVTAGPPSNSFASLVCLGLMSQFDVKSFVHNTADYLHHFAEATKHAYWARRAYAGGPEENAPPLDRLLSESYWRDQAAAIDPHRASAFEPPGAGDISSESTTHFVVADRMGNVVSATLTLGHGFGSAVMAEGTGIWLNNSLAYSTFEPKGNPMDALPRARKHSSKTPTLILREGRPWVAIGTPGGHTIPQTVPQMVINLIDFDMTLQDAIDAPRVAFAEPNTLQVGKGVTPGVLSELESRGHQIRERNGIGIAHALRIEPTAGGDFRFEGAADRRGIGLALGID